LSPSIFVTMRFLIVVLVILVCCNHRRSNVKISPVNIARLQKLQTSYVNSRYKPGFDSLIIDSIANGKPFKRKLWYDSSRTLRYFTEVLKKDTSEVLRAYFTNDSLFDLGYHIYDTSGILDAVDYYFENNYKDTTGNKSLLLNASTQIERVKFLYNKYRKLIK
jgi:hypothetical protein